MRPRYGAATMVVVALALTGCSQAEQVRQAALDDSTAVTFPSADGVQLAGRLFGPATATAGVVLAHMFPSDQRSWFEFADMLGMQGYRALTFDFRGYCPGGDGGCSRGSKDPAVVWQDVQGAADFLRSQGVQKIALVGASMGGTAALVDAGRQGRAVAAVATLSAPLAFQGIAATPETLQQITAAKLFIAGNGDPARAADAATALGAESGQPQRVEIFPSNDHGTDLLDGNQGENVRTLLLSWLAQYLGP